MRSAEIRRFELYAHDELGVPPMRRLSFQPEPSVPIAHGARGKEEAIFVSVVWAIDGPRFVAVARTEEDGLTQIARYIAEQAQWQLWPLAVRRVTALLESGDPAGAVTEYFRHVGERWEAEWLTTARLGLDVASGVWSGSLPLSVSLPAGAPIGKEK